MQEPGAERRGVQFAAVDLTAPEQVLYSYKLDGRDTEWIPLGHQATLSIPPLKAGRYVLRVRSTNGDGLDVDNERTLTFLVRRNFFNSGWATLLYLITAAVLVFLLVRRRKPAPENAGAAPEPLPPEHPLWTAPRAYLTPHISGGFRAGVNYERVLDVVLENLERVLKGEPPIHAVDRQLGY